MKGNTKQNPVGGDLKLRKFLFPVFELLVLTISVFAQSSVDLTFNATVSRDSFSSGSAYANITLQPDGKIIAYGNFNNVNGKAVNKIIRLNADGTLDNSFFCACDNFANIGSALIQPDGKIIIAGSTTFNPRMARLNSDGSVDATFTSPFNQQGNPVISYGAKVWAIQHDGKIFATLSTGGQNVNKTELFRLNPDGSIDNSFLVLNFDQRNIRYGLSRMQILPDGKIMMSGNYSYGQIFRVNPDGTKDNTFESPTVVSYTSFVPPYVSDFGFQSNGKIVISGPFISVNGVSRNYLARLNTGGSVDLKFAPDFPGLTISNNIEILSNDKILIQTDSTAANNVYPFFFRLNADGTMDNTFNAAMPVGAWRLDAQERIIFTSSIIENDVTSFTIRRMNTDGSLDNSFNLSIFGISGEVTALAIQSDGKVILGGYYNRVNGVIRRGLARVNTDGSLDTGFVTGTGVADWTINLIVIQPDGKILIGGNFPSYNGTPQASLARLNTDGSIDSSFNPVLGSGSSFGEIRTIAFQADGKILIGGSFSTVNGTNRTSIARLNSDGSLDNSFNPLLGSPAINSIFVQTDGKIAVGGSFTGVNGFNRSNFTRLNADGSLDSSFNAGSISPVLQILRLSDGKYLTLIFNAVLRRNSDGTADTSFNSLVFEGIPNTLPLELERMLLQPDGAIIVVGQFFKVGSIFRNHIVRLSSNGLLDPIFFPRGASDRINDIAEQTDVKLIIGGRFYWFENVARSGAARITSPPFRRVTNFDYDGDGKADISVFRPSENRWYVLRSSDSGVTQQVFAIPGDVPVPADFDGDGKTDFAIFRSSSGDWWYLSSSNGGQAYAHWGMNGDIPRPSDLDGDGKADYIVFRPSDSFWYRYGSSSAPTAQPFGLTGDKPVTGDFDGDGKTDKAIYRPSTGDWWWQSSVDNVQRATHWGISTDLPAPGDYDGDGKTDFAVYRPSEGNWYIFNSSDFSYTIIHWGLTGDKPVAADYDGDGKADIAVYRPNSGIWYILRTTAGYTELPFGLAEDIPTPNSFVQ